MNNNEILFGLFTDLSRTTKEERRAMWREFNIETRYYLIKRALENHGAVILPSVETALKILVCRRADLDQAKNELDFVSKLYAY